MHGGGTLQRIWDWLNSFPRLAGWMGSKTIPQGAATTIYACVAPELESLSGSYFSDCQLYSPENGFWSNSTCKPSKMALDDKLATAVWDKTESLIQAALEEEQAVASR